MSITQVSHQDAFRASLQAAKRNFDAGQRLYAKSNLDGVKASFDAMISECATAYRIARDASTEIKALGIDTDEFLARMRDAKNPRDVKQHQHEVKNPRKSRLYGRVTGQGLTMSSDETSLIYAGPTEIYMGRLNLYDLAQYVTAQLALMG
jgi:hypothetical protein